MNLKLIKWIRLLLLCLTAAVCFVIYIINSDYSISHESGFYDSDFYLTIKAPYGIKIYYTVDASEPTTHSLEYKGPILITDTSVNTNVYSNRTDVSVDFYKDILSEKGVKSFGYVCPEKYIDKANIVRIGFFNRNGDRVFEETRVYYVGYDEKTSYDNLNIISVTANPEDLFDYHNGIYVTGEYFDQFCQNGFRKDGRYNPNIGFWDCNYSQKGIDWERPAYVQLFNIDREKTYDGIMGIRIQGGSSRGFVNKSLNLFVRDKYESTPIDEELIFDYTKRVKSLNLYNCAHASDTKLPDYLVNSLARDLNVSVREFQPYALFLEGEFWGVYWLAPRYDEVFFSSEYGVDEDNIIEIKLESLEIGRESDGDTYNEMKNWIVQNDMTVHENYLKACELIDMDSYIDYCAVEFYIANRDWPNNNTALWRTRNVQNKEFSDGKWRWILFDVNISMEYACSQFDMRAYVTDRDPFLCSLLESPEFVEGLNRRLIYLADNNFNPSRINSFIDDYETMMGDGIMLEYERFYENQRFYEEFYTKCESIREFFAERYDYFKSTIDLKD